MTLGGDDDLEGMKAICRVVSECLREMAGRLQPGVTTGELDEIGARYLASEGAVSAPMASYDFPGHTCISVNEEVAHGIPGDRVVAEGDLVHIDVSAAKGGYYGDVGVSLVAGEPTAEQRRICSVGRRALARAVQKARPGAPLRALGRAMEREARRAGLGVIRNLGSHGIGRALHDDPRYIPGFDDGSEKRRLHEGLVLTVEPFVTNGRSEATTAADGWTLLNEPGSMTVQFEHTIVVTRGKPLVLTTHP